MNFHTLATNIIKNCSTYSQARKELKKYSLTKSEVSSILRAAKLKGQKLTSKNQTESVVMNSEILKLFQESILDNLKERGVDLEKTKVVVDTENNYATFFLYNLSGQLVGYQFYNPTGSKDMRNQNKFDKSLMKYYTYVTGQNKEKQLAVFGLETYDMKAPYLFVTEGLFDAVKIQNAGYPAIAVLSNDPRRDMKSWLFSLPQMIIAILDNDENMSGNKLRKFSHHSFKTPDPYKDLGDMKQEDVNDFIEECLKSIK